MAKTRTGNFPIGFRRGWSSWQHGSAGELARWAAQHDFEAVDLMNITPADLRAVSEAGIRIGSLDLLDFGKLMSSDTSKRRELIERNVNYVKQLTEAGVRAFFTCIIPAEPSAKRAENYKLAVECFAPIAQTAAERGAYANLCCTPETLRMFLRDVGVGAGVNYDPSHLIRLGVDHIRFLREFAPNVRHVHAKDTQLNPEALYEVGTQASAFAKPHDFGEWNWRYTLPGHGEARWSEIFLILAQHDYGGVISIELEDENFNGNEDSEKSALDYSREFLTTA